MPNIKSQIKRVATNAKRNDAVTSFKSMIKTSTKKVLKAVEENNKEAAVLALNETNSLLDKSLTSKIYTKNYVARHKSRLSKLVNSL